jgi:hypothetical protein
MVKKNCHLSSPLVRKCKMVDNPCVQIVSYKMNLYIHHTTLDIYTNYIKIVLSRTYKISITVWSKTVIIFIERWQFFLTMITKMTYLSWLMVHLHDKIFPSNLLKFSFKFTSNFTSCEPVSNIKFDASLGKINLRP